MESILTSIKKLLGITEEYTQFDTDIIIHINSVFAILSQLGVGSSGFMITDATATWNDYIPDNVNLGLVKSYIYTKVRLIFDPPSNSNVLDATSRSIAEFEWRLTNEADPPLQQEEEIQNE